MYIIKNIFELSYSDSIQSYSEFWEIKIIVRLHIKKILIICSEDIQTAKDEGIEF